MCGDTTLTPSLSGHLLWCFVGQRKWLGLWDSGQSRPYSCPFHLPSRGSSSDTCHPKSARVGLKLCVHLSRQRLIPPTLFANKNQRQSSRSPPDPSVSEERGWPPETWENDSSLTQKYHSRVTCFTKSDPGREPDFVYQFMDCDGYRVLDDTRVYLSEVQKRFLLRIAIPENWS